MQAAHAPMSTTTLKCANAATPGETRCARLLATTLLTNNLLLL